MCGIFGFSIKDQQNLKRDTARQLLEALAHYSESRGKEATGLAYVSSSQHRIMKSPKRPSLALKEKAYTDFINSASKEEAISFIGHSRLVTHGERETEENNQPVEDADIIGIHNGIVVNHCELWQQFGFKERKSDLDSEIIFRLLQSKLDESSSPVEATQHSFQWIEGMASIAVLSKKSPWMILATNNGSLYCYTAESLTVFASEEFILKKALCKVLKKKEEDILKKIHKIQPLEAYRIDTQTATMEKFSLHADVFKKEIKKYEKAYAGVASPERGPAQEFAGIAGGRFSEALEEAPTHENDPLLDEVIERFSKREEEDVQWAAHLKRCKKCLLPETMPFVDFDEQGICFYCRTHKPLKYLGMDALKKKCASYRSKDSKIDCVVGISGGRDSLYSLHIVKKVLGLNPIAYTYDWGMVTDLARRNISRVCAKLGVEHILVAADIPKKRKFIRQNILAWLKKPHLGMIPLFMAGDKQYFYYLNKVRKQVGAPVAILGENMLERTDFKTGFAGVKPYREDDRHVYTLPLSSKVKLFLFYLKQFVTNPSYMNGSLWDTMWASTCYYFLNRNYINLYNYVPWNEEEVNQTLIKEYDFEKSPDTESTWRIGDGTAPFYNYIYYHTVGFSENDTLRSNQIRNHLIKRDNALSKVISENTPRHLSLFWYFKVVGLDPLSVLEKIHHIQHKENNGTSQ